LTNDQFNVPGSKFKVAASEPVNLTTLNLEL
jgi:hypothetical protein